MRVIDLCSGLGGASQAFVDEGHEVITVDIEKKFRPTIQADVQHIPIRSDLKPDLVIFSPPCQCFSVLSIRYHWQKDGTPNPETVKAIGLVKKGLKEIERIKPRYWIMENPMGMLRKVIGKPPNTIRMSDYGAPWKKMTDLWGNVPLPMLMAMRPWPKIKRGSHEVGSTQGNKIWWPRRTEAWQRKLTSAERAKWPYGLSKAVLDAVK
jgi:site-specific DNA-cytosine methylase